MEMLPIPESVDASGPEIRVLTDVELKSLAPRFEAHGGTVPPDCGGVGIFVNGLLVGFQLVQLRLHVQPTEIDTGYSHLFPALCRATEAAILARFGPQWVYVFTTPGRMAALAESRGMVVEPWVVLSKLVQPEIPTRPTVEFFADAPVVPNGVDTSAAALSVDTSPASSPDGDIQ